MAQFSDEAGSPPRPGGNSRTRRAARFPDLRSAGRDLAPKLAAYAGADTVVLAIARGGTPTALEVAMWLGAPLDVVIIRRLVAPNGPGSEICAVSVGGTLVFDESLLSPHDAPDYFIADALEALARRERACRGARPVIDLAEKTVILVDCGIHTGSTVSASVGALRARGPARIVVAVPVAASQTRAAVEAIADEVVCLAWLEKFGHTGLWYADFKRPDDEQTPELLSQAELGAGKRPFAL